MAEHQDPGLIFNTVNLREQDFGIVINSAHDYISPRRSIEGLIRTLSSAKVFCHRGKETLITPGERILELHFEPIMGSEQPQDALEILKVLEIGVSDYIHLLRSLSTPESEIFGIPILYGSTNPRMANFAVQLFGYNYEIIPDSLESHVFGIKEEVLAKLPLLEKLDGRLAKIFKRSPIPRN